MFTNYELGYLFRYLSADGIERCKEGLAQPTIDNVVKAALDVRLAHLIPNYNGTKSPIFLV